MKNSKIRVVKKNTLAKNGNDQREPVTMRLGSRISVITFPERKDGRVKGEIGYRSDYAVPVLRETSSVMQEVADV